ncbi:tyrosine-type recombinase/integrase [Patescibacteria group bacterium]|nr:tyrosine-type recombinase/integrase [Patescibacteria group bacterium]
MQLQVVQGPENLSIDFERFIAVRNKDAKEAYNRTLGRWLMFLDADLRTMEGSRAFCDASLVEGQGYIKKRSEEKGQIPRDCLSDDRTSGATLRKEHVLLKKLYSHAMSFGYPIKMNPFSFPPPSVERNQKRVPDMVPFDKIQKLLDIPTLPRDKALLTIMVAGGLRPGEAVSLKVGDLKRHEAGVYYLVLRATKNKKDAMQAIPDWAAMTVEALIRERRRSGATREDYLFVSQDRGGIHLHRRSCWALFKKYVSEMNLKTVHSPRDLRCTYVSKLLNDGFNHSEVKECSRHSSVQMVEKYDKRRKLIQKSPAKNLSF